MTSKSITLLQRVSILPSVLSRKAKHHHYRLERLSETLSMCENVWTNNAVQY